MADPGRKNVSIDAKLHQQFKAECALARTPVQMKDVADMLISGWVDRTRRRRLKRDEQNKD